MSESYAEPPEVELLEPRDVPDIDQDFQERLAENQNVLSDAGPPAGPTFAELVADNQD